jgi:peptidoglycan hydrolase-like protein with peptidoglycan-binding domain
MSTYINENVVTDAIKQIQQTLNNSGKKIKVDGVFGPATAAAVMSSSQFKAKSNNTSKNYYDKTRSTEFDTQFEICKNLYKVLDGEPELYFKKFTGLLNDNELAAQKWFMSAWEKAWGPTMAKLLKSTNTTIRTNATNIKTMVDQFAKYIGEEHIGAARSSGMTYTLILKHPTDTEQNETFKIRFDYM